jgi:hypothetical protein
VAFHSTTVEGIYKELQERINVISSIAHIEFDDDEYRELRRQARRIFQREDAVKSERCIFLAFACEYTRRNIYLRDYAFWEDFLEELGSEAKSFSSFVANDVLWPAYGEFNISQHAKNRKEVVESLIDAVGEDAAQVHRDDFVNFFCWYYQHHTDAQDERQTQIRQELIQSYEQQTGKTLPIHVKALSRVNKDCQLWTNIFNQIEAQSETTIHDDLDAYINQIITSRNKHISSFLERKHNQEIFRSIFRRLQNHYTPETFLQVLKGSPEANVRLPQGYYYKAKQVLHDWKARTLPYGPYKVGNTTYRVVPLPWLWLETIAHWPDETVIRIRQHIAYKKTRPFGVKIGKRLRQSEIRKCYFEGHESQRYYLWVAPIPKGEPLLIDGHLCQESAGLDWDLSPELGYNDEGEPIIKIVIDKLVAFYPDAEGRTLYICTTQGHKERRLLHVENYGGVCHLYRAISFPLEALDTPPTVSIYLEDKLIDSKRVEAEPAYLFSRQTGKRIPPETNRAWGEHNFYLFTSEQTRPTTNIGVSLEQLDIGFGQKTIYEVQWGYEGDSGLPFFLQTGKLSWSFHKPGYFSMLIRREQPVEGIYLSERQIQSFRGEQIEIYTNQITNLSHVTCKLSYMTQYEPEQLQAPLEHLDSNRYIFTQAALRRLSNLTTEKHYYGQVDLIFYEEQQEIGQATVVIIPQVSISIPNSSRLVLEHKPVYVTISSPHAKLWDSEHNALSSSIYLQLLPRVTPQEIPNQTSLPMGIRLLGSEKLTSSLLFPEIGQVVTFQFHPTIFGFRLYQRQNQQQIYYQIVQTLDYYQLDKSFLYVFARANSSVTLTMADQVVLSAQTDTQGNCLLRSLSLCKQYCSYEQTEVSVENEGLKSTFFIRWMPRIQELTVENNRVALTIDGPLKTGVLARFVDAKHVTLKEERIACQARRFSLVLDGQLPGKRKARYILFMYYLANNDIIPSAWQCRLTVQMNDIFSEFLSAGLGVSDERLLTYFSVE